MVSMVARAVASPADAAPRGIGLPSFRPASIGASTASFRAPIETWKANMAAASRTTVAGAPPASAAIAPVASAFRSDGKG